MNWIRCIVERITYQNPDNGYSVLKVRIKNYTDLVTVVGNLMDANVGSVLRIEGNWKLDQKFGQQFVAEKWEETLPATVYGIEKYLGSGLIKGIGPKFAKRIVGLFGVNTLQIIEDTPERLTEVPGIGKKRIDMIQKGWEQQKEIKNIMLFLQGHDVSAAHAAKIYKTYGNDSIKIIKDNPYQLANDIWGIGFKTADQIASRLGFGANDFVRCRSGLLYTLNQLANEGHTFAQQEQLIQAGCKLLGAEEPAVATALNAMLQSDDLILDSDAIYLPAFYYSETGVSKKLLELASARGIKTIPDYVDIQLFEKSSGIKYDEVQGEAIKQAMNSKIMVLTGGPGTGKTTTTKGIITAFHSYRLDVLLAAPTGRAAKRMTETTGLESKTIHRLLEFKPPGGYQKNEENPLEGDVLIIDECSMIDIILMYNLLKAIPPHMRLILVGDVDQLPSVGAGNVLRDIIDSESIPVIKLTRIFRQAQNSSIIMNAHRVNSGKFPDITTRRTSDFFFIEDEDPERVATVIVDLVKSRLPRHYKIRPSEIQVLTPMQRGVVGASNLNASLQEALNPANEYLRRSGIEFRKSDKVMQIRNNYDKEVFNGDIGIVTVLDTESRELTVDFDGREIVYDVTELDELVQAYAITIHKAQGSEYPAVVMPILMTHYIMLQRNLIYTGITRAKKLLVLIGSKKALYYAVNHLTVTKRNTKLRERLSSQL